MAGFPWVELLLVCGRYLGTQLLAEARFRTHSSARRIRFVLEYFRNLVLTTALLRLVSYFKIVPALRSWVKCLHTTYNLKNNLHTTFKKH